MVDKAMTLEQVEKQLEVFQLAALHLHRCGVQVYVREGADAEPRRIID